MKMNNDDIKDDNIEAVETEAPQVNHVDSMIDSLIGGDNVAAQDSFKSALTDKIGAALDDKRKNIANDWLNAAAVQNDEEDNTEEQPEVEKEDEPVVS